MNCCASWGVVIKSVLLCERGLGASWLAPQFVRASSDAHRQLTALGGWPRLQPPNDLHGKLTYEAYMRSLQGKLTLSTQRVALPARPLGVPRPPGAQEGRFDLP